MRAYYFGCWNEAGHFLHADWGARAWEASRTVEYCNRERTCHLDGSLAPRVDNNTGAIGCYFLAGKTRDARQHYAFYRSEECPQGQFLRHVLTTGFTAIQWWDRNQGDERGACNSTVLVEGEHTTEEMLAAMREHFPHVLENLEAGGPNRLDHRGQSMRHPERGFTLVEVAIGPGDTGNGGAR